MTLLHHTCLVLRLVARRALLWWRDRANPALRSESRAPVAAAAPTAPPARAHVMHGAVASWCLAWAAILWGGATLPGALVAALAGSYSLISLPPSATARRPCERRSLLPHQPRGCAAHATTGADAARRPGPFRVPGPRW